MKTKFSFSRVIAGVMFVLILVGLSLPSARAQGVNGFDFYSVPRFITWSPTMLTNHSGTLTASNAPVDLHGFDGVASVFLTTSNYAGNAGTPAFCARLFGSQDNTNWFLMTNCSYATAATYNITNKIGGVVATNQYLLPGTVTTPTAATAGFASPYLVPQPFTNAGVILTNVSGGSGLIGWSVQDGPRYVQVQYIVTGTDVAFTVNPVIIARRSAGDFFY